MHGNDILTIKRMWRREMKPRRMTRRVKKLAIHRLQILIILDNPHFWHCNLHRTGCSCNWGTGRGGREGGGGWYWWWEVTSGGETITPIKSTRGNKSTSTKIMEGLEDKLLESNCFGQCRWTVLGRIPHVVTLKPHPTIIVKAATKLDWSDKMDLDAVGIHF